MPFSFDIKIPDNFEKQLPKLQEKAKTSGLFIERNGHGYNFSGFGVEGTFEIIGDNGHITVTNKPFFLTENMIIQTITDYLRNQS